MRLDHCAVTDESVMELGGMQTNVIQQLGLTRRDGTIYLWRNYKCHGKLRCYFQFLFCFVGFWIVFVCLFWGLFWFVLVFFLLERKIPT